MLVLCTLLGGFVSEGEIYVYVLVIASMLMQRCMILRSDWV